MAHSGNIVEDRQGYPRELNGRRGIPGPTWIFVGTVKQRQVGLSAAWWAGDFTDDRLIFRTL